MKANQLKGLLCTCSDKTDLPTQDMLEAGARALDRCQDIAEVLGRQGVVKEIWDSMLEALPDPIDQPKDYAEE